MTLDVEKVITDKAEETRRTFQALLDKTNKENPSPKDVNALAELLSDHKALELWRDIASAGYLAEILVIENARATAAVKECWNNVFKGSRKISVTLMLRCSSSF